MKKSIMLFIGFSISIISFGQKDFFSELSAKEILSKNSPLLKRVQQAIDEKSYAEIEVFGNPHNYNVYKFHQSIIPIIKSFQGKASLKQFHYVTEKMEEKMDTIMHDLEIEEAKRQLVIQNFYPEKYLDYLFERGKYNFFGPRLNPVMQVNWETTLKVIGLDSSAIENIAQLSQSDDIQKELSKSIESSSALISKEVEFLKSDSLLVSQRKLQLSTAYSFLMHLAAEKDTNFIRKNDMEFKEYINKGTEIFIEKGTYVVKINGEIFRNISGSAHGLVNIFQNDKKNAPEKPFVKDSISCPVLSFVEGNDENDPHFLLSAFNSSEKKEDLILDYVLNGKLVNTTTIPFDREALSEGFKIIGKAPKDENCLYLRIPKNSIYNECQSKVICATLKCPSVGAIIEDDNLIVKHFQNWTGMFTEILIKANYFDKQDNIVFSDSFLLTNRDGERAIFSIHEQDSKYKGVEKICVDYKVRYKGKNKHEYLTECNTVGEKCFTKEDIYCKDLSFDAQYFSPSDGIIEIQAYSKYSPIQILWETGDTTPIAKNLKPNIPSCVTVKDSRGCSKTNCFTMGENLKRSNITKRKDRSDCNDFDLKVKLPTANKANGEIAIIPEDTSKIVQIKWKGTNKTFDFGDMFKNDLPTGSYDIEVLSKNDNRNECISRKIFHLPSTAILLPPLEIDYELISPDCAGNSGSLNIKILDPLGTPPFFIEDLDSWKRSVDTFPYDRTFQILIKNQSRLSLDIWDASGRQTKIRLEIDLNKKKIDLKNRLIVIEPQIFPASDCVKNNGSIIFNDLNNFPYKYHWNNGESNFELKNLKSGVYKLFIENPCGDSTVLEYEVPSEKSIVNYQLDWIRKDERCTGGVKFINPDSENKYKLEFNLSQEKQEQKLIKWVTDSVFNVSNLCSANYEFKIKHNGGCIFNKHLRIENCKPFQPQVEIKHANPDCNAKNGVIKIYNYQQRELLWSNGVIGPLLFDLSPGKYKLKTILKNGGCPEDFEYEILCQE